MAQRRTGGVLKNGLRRAHAQQKCLGVEYLVLDFQGHRDNVGVLGEHFLADFVAAVLAHVHRHALFDDRRAPVQARVHHPVELTEAQHHAALALIHQVKAHQHIADHQHHQRHRQQAAGEAAGRLVAAATAAAFAAEQVVDAVLKIFQRFIKIGRSLIATAAAPAPGVPGFVSAGFIPGH